MMDEYRLDVKPSAIQSKALAGRFGDGDVFVHNQRSAQGI